MKLLCPVCGYDQIDEPQLLWSICPSCGTQFGYSDAGISHEELRAEWIGEGAHWTSTTIARPRNWDPVQQLRNIGYKVSEQEMLKIKRAQTPMPPMERDTSPAKPHSR